MKERGIIFSAPMVRALLAGTKTQTRRIVKPPKGREAAFAGVDFGCPYGAPGDRLWVRETFAHEPADYCWEASVSIPCRPAVTTYRADVEALPLWKGWTSSIHMPRKLSRITLELTDVRVERLQDISEADAKAEGSPCVDEPTGREVLFPAHDGGSYKLGYRALWESINGAGSWDANPWVWVLTMKKID